MCVGFFPATVFVICPSLSISLLLTIFVSLWVYRNKVALNANNYWISGPSNSKKTMSAVLSFNGCHQTRQRFGFCLVFCDGSKNRGFINLAFKENCLLRTLKFQSVFFITVICMMSSHYTFFLKLINVGKWRDHLRNIKLLQCSSTVCRRKYSGGGTVQT